MKRVLALIVVAAGLLWSGCTTGETDPATDVTATSAQLYGHGYYTDGDSGEWWFEARRDGGSWVQVTQTGTYGDPTQDCNGQGAAHAKTMSKLATRLAPDSHYDFRLAATWCGSPGAVFHTGADENSKNRYDSFDTLPLQPTGPVGPWVLTFHDEFTGTSLSSAWNTNWFGPRDAITRSVTYGDQACADPAQVSVSGGTLNLRATKQSVVCDYGSGPVTEPYRIGLVNTYRHFDQSGGAFEARINLPGDADGLWNFPAWWTNRLPGDPKGEMDIMEGLSSRTPCWFFHSDTTGAGGCSHNNYANEWHTYTAEWVPGQSATYYYDGVQVGRLTSGITSANMFLILDNAVSRWGGPSHPDTMRVAYVRVWRR
jgi:beta-glucanase (GH16 family)